MLAWSPMNGFVYPLKREGSEGLAKSRSKDVALAGSLCDPASSAHAWDL